MLTIRFFGGLSIHNDGAPVNLPSQNSRSLLAYCAAHADRLHSRSHLAGIFWPDLPNPTARRRLSHALWEIGQALPPIGNHAYLIREADAIGFNRRLPHEIDLLLFKDGWRQAQNAHNLTTARLHLRMAADLYTGDFLAGFYDDWVLVEQERLREIYLQILQRLMDTEKATGAYDAALRAALALIAVDPLQETAYQQAMRLALQLSRPQEARRLYEQCQATFRAELGIEPAPETAAILTQPEAPTSPARSEAPAFSGEDLPLVGREQERQSLLRWLAETQRGGGGVVLLAGEAGVGKSRLLRALAEDAAWRSMTVLWGQAQDRASEPGHGAPYAPLTSALSHGLSPLRGQQLAALLDRLWIGVAGCLLPQLAQWLPDLTPLPPMPPEQERIRLLEGLVRVILALGEIAPTLLILEDLHWADEATFDALVYLSQRLPASHVLLVASFRPGVAQESAAARQGLQALDQMGVGLRLALAPFGLEETAELIRRGLGLSAPAALFTSRLHQETGGNPLFVLESLHTLHAEGMLTRNQAGEWATPFDGVTTDYAELPFSPAVERTIARRLDRIGGVERGTLAAAAVLGGELSLPLLAQVSGQSGRDLLLALGGLVRHNLLQETTTAYRFSHEKVRETVYGELTPDQRRRLHRRVGAAMAREQSAAASVARHLEMGEDWGQAAHFHWLAGQQAVSLHSYGPALAHLDRAETFSRWVGQRKVDAFTLFLLREEVLDRLGERERQRIALEELAHLAGEQSTRRLVVYQRYGRFLNEVGEYGAALAQLEAGLTLAQAQADGQNQVRLLALLGKTLYRQGDLQAALPMLERAIAQAQAIPAPDVEAEAQATLTGVCNDLSDHAGATAAGEQAILLYRQAQNPVGEADVLTTLGAVAMEQGRLDEADAYFSQALPVIRASGYRYAEARCLVNWGSIDYLRGRLGEALERFRLGAQIFHEIGSERGRHFTNLNIAATVSAYVGPDEKEEDQTRQALAFFTEQANPSATAQALGILGRLAQLRGEWETTLAFFEQGLAHLAGAADPWVEAQAYQSRATVHLARQAWTDALADVEAGLALGERYDFDDLSPLFLALRSQSLLGLGQVTEALAAANKAAQGRKPTDYAAHIIHFCHHRALARAGDHPGAWTAIQRSYESLGQILATLSPPDQARSRREIPEHQAILSAWEAYRPVTQRVRLPRIDATTGRPLTADEEVEVAWTVETAADRAILSKTERRQGQILRLLHEAQAQGALPAYHHLAEALDVSERTIKRDMAALRQTNPQLPPTRGG